MTNPFRAMCAELLNGLDELAHPRYPFPGYTRCAMDRARALLAQQPEPERSKPVVDYSRVPEIATDAQIRSAAQYLVKKRNCDGDLIPAIEYAIARWGCPKPQPESPELTDQEIANAAKEALDSYRYSTELPYFLEDHASEREPIMLAFRAAIAADRARRA